MVSVLEQYGSYDCNNHCTKTESSRASLNVSVTGGENGVLCNNKDPSVGDWRHTANK